MQKPLWFIISTGTISHTLLFPKVKHKILIQHFLITSVIILILQMKQTRHKEVKSLAQDHSGAHSSSDPPQSPPLCHVISLQEDCIEQHCPGFSVCSPRGSQEKRNWGKGVWLEAPGSTCKDMQIMTQGRKTSQ